MIDLNVFIIASACSLLHCGLGVYLGLSLGHHAGRCQSLELLIHGLFHLLVLFMHGLHSLNILDPVPKRLVDVIHFFLRLLALCGNMGLVGKVAERIVVVCEFLVLRSLQILLLFL